MKSKKIDPTLTFVAMGYVTTAPTDWSFRRRQPWDARVYDIATRISQQDGNVIALLAHPVALVDRHGVVVDCNRPFRDHAAPLTTASAGLRVAELLAPADRQACLAYLQQCAASRRAPLRPFSATIPSGGAALHLSLAPLKANDPSAGFLCQIEKPAPQDDPRLNYLMEHLDQGVWDYDVPSGRLTVSRMWRDIRGIAVDVDINAPGRRWKENTHPEDRVTLQAMFDSQVRGERSQINIQYRYRHMDGHWIWVLCRAKVVTRDQSGTPLRIVGTDTDVTKLRRRDSDVLQLTNTLKLAIDASGIGIWEFDRATNEVHWDDRMLEIYGITDGQNIRHGDLWKTYLHPDDLESTQAYSDHCQQHGLDFRRDYRIVRPDGGIRYIRSLAGYVAPSSQQAKLVGVNIDVTEDYERSAQLEAARAQLEHDSRHDALTGLANRRLLDERVEALCTTATPDCKYVVMHLDLDYFKQINDTLGHLAGDAVLVHVAKTLRDLIGDRGLVCRSGGDEFVVLFETAPDADALKNLCKTIVTAFETPFHYAGQHCAFGVSIGCAFGQGPPLQHSEIFIRADSALYAAKQAGRGCYRIYSDETVTSGRAKAHVRQLLLDALTKGEITCYYQPQFDAHTQQISGAEALVRWHCPDRGVLKPDAFMPTATELGLADRIDAYVFEQVIAQQSRWFAAGLSYPVIAMNVSMDRFRNGQLIDHVRNLIAPHHAIAFELLETAFLDDLSPDQAARLTELRALGIGIDLDDFGSGHSSVAAMQAIQPDRIKVDQSLVAPITARPEQLKTLQLLSQLARLEGLQIVMEGLDTQGHLDAIAQVDCDLLQGFALGKPMPADAFSQLLCKR